MLGAIGDTLSLAIGIAISPIPIIATILILLSSKAKRISPAFLAGWIVGIVAVTSIFILVGGATVEDSQKGSAPVAGIVKLLLGLALTFLAVQQWRHRPKSGEDPELPGWMNAITSMPPVKAFGFGALLSGPNPKNLLLSASAGVVIGSASLGTGSTIVVVLIFAVIASVSVGGPIIGYLMAPDRITPVLQAMRVWLEQNNATVMAVVMLVMGTNMIGNGIASF